MPPILWGCVIAPPGRKKSPATSPAISIIKELEYELREKSLPSIKEQKTNLEFEKTRRKSILSRIEQELRKGNEIEAHYSSQIQMMQDESTRMSQACAKRSEFMISEYRGDEVNYPPP